MTCCADRREEKSETKRNYYEEFLRVIAIKFYCSKSSLREERKVFFSLRNIICKLIVATSRANFCAASTFD